MHFSNLSGRTTMHWSFARTPKSPLRSWRPDEAQSKRSAEPEPALTTSTFQRLPLTMSSCWSKNRTMITDADKIHYNLSLTYFQHARWQLDLRLWVDLPPDRHACASHCAGSAKHVRRPMGSQTLLGRRAVRQDAGYFGAGPHRARSGDPHEGVGHAHHRLRSDHHTRRGCCGGHWKNGARADLAAGRLHNGAYAVDSVHAK